MHAFDPELANPETGGSMAQAVIAESLRLWIIHNRATERNEREGRWWTFCSLGDLRTRHPYLSEYQIRMALEALVGRGILLRQQFNKATLDRRYWYAFTDEAVHLARAAAVQDAAFPELAKTTLRSVENQSSKVRIPDIEGADTAVRTCENHTSYKEQVLKASTYGTPPSGESVLPPTSEEHAAASQISTPDFPEPDGTPEEPDPHGLLNRPKPEPPATPAPRPAAAPKPPARPKPPPAESSAASPSTVASTPTAKAKRKAPVAKTPEGAAKQACVAAYVEEFETAHGLKPIILGRQAGDLGRVVTQLRAVLECDWPEVEPEFRRLLGVFFATDWLTRRGSTTQDFLAQINALRGAGVTTDERRDDAGKAGSSASGPGRYRATGGEGRGRITEEQLAINREKIRQWTDPNWRPSNAYTGPNPFVDWPA